ncbi:MAG: DUF4340 domain-containing protein [Betaproteobacteria bacterium]
MTRGWLLNAVLLLAVAALASFLAFRPRSDAPGQHRLTTLKANAVSDIRLERSGRPPVLLRRENNQWTITAPVPARADNFQVARLLGILDATATQRLPGQDLARFGLDSPLARLTIDGAQFDFGSVNAVTREQYVLTAGVVHAVAPRYGAALAGDVSELIARQPFPAGESPVRFAFPGFTIAQDGNRWQVMPASGDVSQDDINRWIDAWRHAHALRAEPDPGGTPLETITIQMRSGTGLALHVVQKGPEYIIARPDEKLRYHFAPEIAKRLLAPPAAPQ